MQEHKQEKLKINIILHCLLILTKLALSHNINTYSSCVRFGVDNTVVKIGSHHSIVTHVLDKTGACMLFHDNREKGDKDEVDGDEGVNGNMEEDVHGNVLKF